MASYHFTLDLGPDRNVLFIVQEGQPTAAGFRKLMKRYKSALEKLKSGATVVNDQRKLEAYDAEAAKVAEELVRVTNDSKVARLIRIVPESLLSQATVSRSFVGGRGRYENINVRDEAEAEALLRG